MFKHPLLYRGLSSPRGLLLPLQALISHVERAVAEVLQEHSVSSEGIGFLILFKTSFYFGLTKIGLLVLGGIFIFSRVLKQILGLHFVLEITKPWLLSRTVTLGSWKRVYFSGT